MRVLAALAAAGLLLVPSAARAARLAQVDVENAELREGPEKGAKVLEKLSKGSYVNTSNEATEGCYKVRTAGGSVGFVQADALVLMEGSGDDAKASTPASLASKESAVSGFRRRFPNATIKLRAFGGLSMFNDKDVNTNFGFDDLKNGFGYGMELNFVFASDIAVVFRVERVLKSLVARDSASLKTFQLDLSSVPAMIGVETEISRDGNFSTQFVGLVGIGIGTKLVSTGLNFDPPNETVFNDTPFTVLAKFNVNWRVTHGFSLFFEGGYRILKTGQISTSIEGNGADIFKPNGTATPITLDMTGPVLGGGLSFNL